MKRLDAILALLILLILTVVVAQAASRRSILWQGRQDLGTHLGTGGGSAYSVFTVTDGGGEAFVVTDPGNFNVRN